MRLTIIGELSTNTYEKDGAKITKLFVNTKTVDFIDTIKKEENTEA